MIVGFQGALRGGIMAGKEQLFVQAALPAAHLRLHNSARLMLLLKLPST